MGFDLLRFWGSEIVFLCAVSPVGRRRRGGDLDGDDERGELVNNLVCGSGVSPFLRAGSDAGSC